MRYFLNGINFYLDENCIKILNGFQTTSKSMMKFILKSIKEKHPECKVFTRSINSLVSEWKAHNRLYKLGYKKERTKDVDLDLNETWFRKLLYWIISI